MSKRIKNLISSFSGMLPVEKLILASGQQFIFPFWHSVSDQTQPHLSQIYQVPTIEEFERDLDFFLKNFKPATIKDVLRQTDQSKKGNPGSFFYQLCLCRQPNALSPAQSQPDFESNS